LTSASHPRKDLDQAVLFSQYDIIVHMMSNIEICWARGDLVPYIKDVPNETNPLSLANSCVFRDNKPGESEPGVKTYLCQNPERASNYASFCPALKQK